MHPAPLMSARFPLLVVVILLGGVVEARAQQAVVNVPSADVLDRGRLYLETDHYARPWETESPDAAFFLVRAVYGMGSQVEVGANLGPFDYLRESHPFLDAAIKVRMLHVEIGPDDPPSSASLIVGAHPGAALRDDLFRNYAYAAGAFRAASTQTRAGAGVYHATRNVFTDESRFGVQLTAEQPVAGIPGFTIVADWFSGVGGYATPGFSLTNGTFTLIAGYGFANTGRQDDLLTLEFGALAF